MTLTDILIIAGVSSLVFIVLVVIMTAIVVVRGSLDSFDYKFKEGK